MVRAMSALRVEFFFDEEASNWHFRVPALHINGGGQRPGRMLSASPWPLSLSHSREIPGITTAMPRLSLWT
jgi:hypothetical protein